MDRRLRRRTLLGLGSAAAASWRFGGFRTAAPIGSWSRAAVAAAPRLQADPSPPSLNYVAGSSLKIEQVIGDFDKQAQLPTTNQTGSRFGIAGTDLGSSFEHEGRLYCLFGDVLAPGAPDPIAWSTTSDPNAALQLQFLSAAPGRFIPVQAPGVSMGPFEVPGAGISLNGTLYVVVLTDYTPDRSSYRSVLLAFDERTQTFSQLRMISSQPDGHFINMALRQAPAGLAGLPDAQPYVLMFGSGDYRKSSAYLAAVPAASFATGAGTAYFAGLSGGQPTWAATDDQSAPIVDHPVIGELSVISLASPGLWVMTYNSSNPQGIILRYAAQPWGPWSDIQVVYNARRDGGLGAFIHDPTIVPDDGLAGRVTAGDAEQIAGGVYGPYLIERFTELQAGGLSLHYLLSTWNPYTVVRMRSTFAFGG